MIAFFLYTRLLTYSILLFAYPLLSKDNNPGNPYGLRFHLFRWHQISHLHLLIRLHFLQVE